MYITLKYDDPKNKSLVEEEIRGDAAHPAQR